MRDSLSLDNDLQVVGEAATGEQAMQMARELQPRVVLMDVNLPGGLNGLQVVQRMRKETPGTRTIVLTAYDDEEQLFHAIRAGAHAYFPKDVSPDRIMEVIHEINLGKYVVGTKTLSEEQLAPWLLHASERFGQASSELGDDVLVSVSPREMEILKYITRGMSNKLIAHTLGISHQTVKNHMTSILRKLDVEDRTQAAIYAIRHGWVRLQDTQNQADQV